MSDDIEITVQVDNPKKRKLPGRYMWILFTLEHRAYSIEEVCELAERLRAEGVEDLHCIKVDCGDRVSLTLEEPT